ncbi:amino acid ABC transporter substrate-binding protein [Cellulomonas wangsupingiae]|uniref:amino acid ABC transporter substrate-binding protein n=1 Tax=Cellulomonas wangsupingiae TaxID=2968085 RepID=UPI001D0E1C61|nr:amino acid ABC transporter substrate-binding protein [Cellulomonas wangsupingiae]MCM0638513.1 amino acid ABC transporter substrate-binding protein [Cellulomonas wangsupingiae]
MLRTSRRLLVLPVALAVGALAACSSGGSAPDASGGAEGGVLRVGTEGTYSPFSFHDADGDLTGYDVEVVTAVADELGLDVEFSETTWDSIFAGLEAERYDVIANQVTVNDERRAKYDFSEPYTVSTGVAVVAADNDAVTSLADVAGLTAAQSATSNWSQIATDAGAKVEGVEGLTQAVALLQQGRVDVTFNDDLAVLDYLQQSGDESVRIAFETGDTVEQAFALRKDSELTAQVDEALATLRADGTLAQISEKWFGEDVSQ